MIQGYQATEKKDTRAYYWSYAEEGKRKVRTWSTIFLQTTSQHIFENDREGEDAAIGYLYSPHASMNMRLSYATMTAEKSIAIEEHGESEPIPTALYVCGQCKE